MRQTLRRLGPAGDARAARGPGLPLPERAEDLTGGQGTVLAGSRGRSRCRTPAFAGLSRKVGRKREGVPGPTGFGVPDARAWAASKPGRRATNKARVATGRGHGSHDTDNPMALVMPGCSDLRPTLPGGAVVT